MTERSQILATRFLILLLALATAFLLLGDSVSADEPIVTTTHVVQPGETLWGIAAGIAEPDEDVRSVISEIKRINELASSSLVIGQPLSLPDD